jgi:sigma-70-like protein
MFPTAVWKASAAIFFWERLTQHLSDRDRHIVLKRLKGAKLAEIGLELGISAERVRQIEEAAIKRPPVGLVELGEYAWKDTRQFYLECLAYRAEGIGYFYRDRRPPAKCQRELLPYEPPKTLVRIARYLGSPENYQRSQEILRTYEMAGKAPYASPTERAAGQPDWDRAAPPKWKADARIVIEAEQSTMFWASDNLREFEIWSWPGYSRGVPFMVHDRAHPRSDHPREGAGHGLRHDTP